uniref:C2H2-type domain-containing protein n=1 Tax=Trichobilharzia regenti TaxID=157069 RepID=A0AA85JX65_TRIRE|nr:unnamed protein product [Trichobilharzia regenti]
MPLVFSNQNYSNPHPNDQELVKQLTDLIRQNVPYSKRLHVLGILSFTTDNGCEKFIKIDSSFSASSEATPDDSPTQNDSSISNSVNESTNCNLQKEECAETFPQNAQVEQHSSTHSPGASPPLLPPSVIQINRAGKADERPVQNSSEDSLVSQSSETALSNEYETDGKTLRRCRRKCRNPKRQIFDSDSHVGDSDVEDAGTDVEDTVHNNKAQDNDPIPAKIPRMETDVVVSVSIPCAKEIQTTTVSNCDSDLISPSLSNNPQEVTLSTAFSTTPAVSSLSFVPMQYATINKCLNPQANSADITALSNSQLNSGTKYAISAKTLGLGDLGDLCGILPINTLLGKTLISGSDVNISSKLVFANNTGTAVSTSGTDTVNHSGFSQPINQCISAASCTNQNLMLNPNLAAAVAAAISNSSLAFSGSSSLVSNGSSLATSIPTLTAPSIALTGPSGEILGTIPIASTNSPQNILSPALGNNVQPSSMNSSLTTVSVTLPSNPNTGSSAGLVNTLNWLRCATTLPESGSHQVIGNFTPANSAPSFSVASGNPVALLHSLVTQQQGVQAQIHKQQSLQPTFSVGPTLALIGTLGLNSPVSCTVSGQHPSETTFTSNTGLSTSVSTVLPTTLHNNIQPSPANNNAALVAAALLRSLTNVKHLNQELTDPNSIDTNSYNPPASLTLITNSIPSSINAAATTRPSILGLEESGGSVSGILASRIAQSTLNVSALSSSLNSVVSSNQAPTICNAISTPTQTISTRSSIMLSYPRGGTEMNLLLTPASGHTFGTSQLTPLTAVPAALSFQGLPTSQPTSLTLTSPVVFHTPVTSTVIQTTSAISESTITTTSSYTGIPSTAFDQTSRKPEKSLTSITDSSHKVTSSTNQTPVSSSDPTSSAIDRILQTIKGCMSANANKESENKLRIRRNESTNTYQTVNSDEANSHRVNDARKTIPNKFSAVNKNGVSLENDCVSRSASSVDRLPLPPLQKGITESSDTCSPLSVNKLYRCRYCGKTFNRKFCRERHERLHTGVKPYSCEICDEKFIRLEDKKRHVRSLQHYLSGRGSLRNSGLDERLDENVAVVVEPSSVLPLLAQTLQGTVNADSSEKGTDTLCTNTDEANFNCHVSENESGVEKTAAELEGESCKPEDNKPCNNNNESKSVSQVALVDGNHIGGNLDTEEEFREKSKLDEASDDLLTSPRITSKIQINKVKCRSALKETQTAVNSTTENHCEIIKIPKVVLLTTEDTSDVKSTS